ncbi:MULTISPECIES: Hsp20/alpha crystallin family protein [Bacillales]|jgi:HSP20 family protein|uniref:Hsp20/alpha crystallin family protein n=1 Tax=Brevibacillus TaxID=55080 RepID=UPI000E3B5378|nr:MULTISPECIES: Hsp20/alpha crystallin family protein [Bacillales]REK66827.1 MAG: heat-shock protein Hsp20 [Brevibacillus sp.]MBR8658820.1 Hsp20/alpha crystallin family protein [Brevibacillus sp. NL20B1]MDT3416440.1 HSP20 family protein [Brevibacillus aydinogluensis]NNV02318.1 Hsp20/alpha crystallin family protein [Brevibacillus sp. MCWH]UFJ62763.1 Hsp20/alpha crystallin family protein [Anoxybacillus sediminis]
MSLIPYEPFRHLENVRRELDRFFTTGMPGLFAGTEGFLATPRIDVYETDTEVVATCDIPGLEKKEDVQIDIENNVLTISGSINKVNEVKENRMHRQERFSGHFSRSVTLPARVSSEGVKATYKNGVLEVRIPKAHPDEKRRIDVEFH